MKFLGWILSVSVTFCSAQIFAQASYENSRQSQRTANNLFLSSRDSSLVRIDEQSENSMNSSRWPNNFGGVDIGSSKPDKGGLLIGSNVSITFTSFNITGQGFSKLPGGCDVGVTFYNTGIYDACYLNLRFTPAEAKLYTGTFVLSYTRTYYNGSGVLVTKSASNVWELTGRGQFRPLENEPPPVCGSIISPADRTVSEEIPIVGTNFSLKYNSRLSSDYVTLQGALEPSHGFNQEAWVLSAQKFYDPNIQRLFSGSGVSSNKFYLDSVTNMTMVVSSDGDEIYVFDDTLKHIKTLTFLTGALKYQFTYDSSDLLTQISDGYGNTTIITRNINGYITKITAPYGQQTNFTLDGNGKILSATNPKNETFTFTYKTGTSLLATFKKPGGQTTTLTYDTNGNLVKDLGSWGNFSKLHTGSSGDVTLKTNMNRQTVYASQVSSSGEFTQTVSEPNLLKTTTYEDGSGASVISTPLESTNTTKVNDERFGDLYRRTSSASYSTGGITSTTASAQIYNLGTGTGFFDFASLTNTATTSGRVTTVQFNNSTKQKTITSPRGIISTIKLDAYEKPIEVQLGSDVPETYSYDANGRLIQSKQGSKNQLDYVYNSAGYLQTVTNARSEQTSYSYDLAGRMTQTIMPSLDVIQYQYDANGNVIAITPPYKATHWFSYNSAELPLTYSVAGSPYPRSFVHNLDKQMTTFNNAGKIATYGYDAQTAALNYIQTANGNYLYTYSGSSGPGLVTAIQSPDGLQNNFTYDGTMISGDEQVKTSDSTSIGRVDFAYDTDYRIVGRFVSSIFGSNYYSLTLNSDDQPTQVGNLSLTYNSVSGRLSTTTIDKVSDGRTYDSYGKLASYTATYQPTSGPSVSLYSYTITRDIMSRIASISETIGSTTVVSNYTYNNRGWLTEVHRTDGTYDIFTYDFNGNRTSHDRSGSVTTSIYDLEDRMTSYGSKTYTYDYNGDLKTSQLSIGATSNYNYDVFGNLVSMDPSTGVDYGNIVDGLNRVAGQKASTVQKRFLYQDKFKIAVELDIATANQKEFVYGSGSQTPDYMISGSNKYRIITNHLGSPRLVVNTTTGVIDQTIDYSILGKVLTDTNPAFQPFGFAGGLYNRNTNLVRFGARDYDAETGRWTVKDPILFDGGDANLYGYVMNDPVNFVDPSGLSVGIVDHPIADPRIGGGSIAIGIGICQGAGKDKEKDEACWRTMQNTIANKCSKLPFSQQGKCITQAAVNYEKCKK